MADDDQEDAPPSGGTVWPVTFVGALEGAAGRHPETPAFVTQHALMVNVHHQVGETGHHRDHEVLVVAVSVQLARIGHEGHMGRRVVFTHHIDQAGVPHVLQHGSDKALRVIVGTRHVQEGRRLLTGRQAVQLAVGVERDGQHRPFGQLERVVTHLPQFGQGVGGQPLFHDAVLSDNTVGDAPAVDLAPTGRAVLAVAGVGAHARHPMRTVKAVLIVAAPDHVVGVGAALGVQGDALQRVDHHRLAPVHGAAGIMHQHVVGVVGVDQTHRLLLPDLVGAAHDVVHDVHVVGIETLHRLPATRPCCQRKFGVVGTVREIEDRKDRGGNGQSGVFHDLPLTRRAGLGLS